MRVLDKLKEASRRLKAEVQVLFIAYKDKRTPLPAKLLIGITIGYLLSPVDLIPDFIPVLGILDDLIIVPLLIKLSLRLIPYPVLADARAAAAASPWAVKKNNLVFAAIIVAIWLGAIYFFYEAVIK